MYNPVYSSCKSDSIIENLVAKYKDEIGNPDEVGARAMLTRKLEMYPIECVVRGALTGSGYAEYREQYLKISATTVNIGSGQGGGSSLIKLDVGSVQTTVVVSGTGSASTQGTPA